MALSFIRLFIVTAGLMGLIACTEQTSSSSDSSNNNEWQFLIDKDLSKFDSYLSFAHKNDYDGTPPKTQDGTPIKPIGLNPEGYDVFTVIDGAETPTVRISGEYYGSLTTKKSYKNYHLKLKFKWGDTVYEPRLTKLKDSGILYHAQGPHGAEHWRSWKLSQELQIMEGHIGDYWSQANSAIDVRAFPREYIMSPIADASRSFLSVGHGQDEKGFVMRSKNMEIADDWNLIELITFEDKSLHIVNGEVVMILAKSRYYDDGVEKPLIKGQIQIQSEAAELFVKDIVLKNISAIPPDYSHLFNSP